MTKQKGSRLQLCKCSNCNSVTYSKVVTSKQINGIIYRRRRCLGCDHRWYTEQPVEVEAIEWPKLYATSNKQKNTIPNKNIERAIKRIQELKLLINHWKS